MTSDDDYDYDDDEACQNSALLIQPFQIKGIVKENPEYETNHKHLFSNDDDDDDNNKVVHPTQI